jgi:hypothetical protein
MLNLKLRQEGIEIGEQEGTDQELLVEVMELREQLDEATGHETVQTMKTENEGLFSLSFHIPSEYFSTFPLSSSSLPHPFPSFSKVESRKWREDWPTRLTTGNWRRPNISQFG